MVRTRTQEILAIFQLQTFCTGKQPKHQLEGDDKAAELNKQRRNKGQSKFDNRPN